MQVRRCVYTYITHSLDENKTKKIDNVISLFFFITKNKKIMPPS